MATQISLSIRKFSIKISKVGHKDEAVLGLDFSTEHRILSTVQNPPRNSSRGTRTMLWNKHPSPKTLASTKLYGLM